MKDILIVLLAGGSSSRFKPLSEKNLYKFLGQSLVRRQVGLFQKNGFEDIMVVASESNFELLKEELAGISGVELLVQKGDGMAGASRTALDTLSEDKELLIVNMVDVFDESLISQFIEIREDLVSNKQCMLTGYKVEEYFPGGYLVFDDDDFISDIIEKPGAGNEPSSYVDIVFHYFYSSELLSTHLSDAKSEKDDVFEVALSNMMKAEISFKLLRYEGRWETIKYPWHVFGVMNYFLSKIEGQNISESAKIADSVIINGDVIIEDDVKIFDGAIINGPVYLGKGSIVGNNALVRSSMIGENCVVGFGSEVARSYFGSNIWLHKNYIGDSILENNIAFGSDSLTANFRLDEGNIKMNVKGERMDTGLDKLGVVIGSHVRVGVNTTFMPGVKVGTNAVVGPGISIEDDVEPNTFVKGEYELEVKENKLDISKLVRE